MTLPVKSLDEVTKHKFDALVVGPGLGNSIFLEGVLDLLDTIDYPVVIDADALNLIAENQSLGSLKESHIVTPHPSEMARLMSESSSLSRSDTVKLFVQKCPATLLYKGSRTIVANKQSALYYNTSGTPGMASGGQGDALSGLLAALLAQKNSPIQAAKAGAWLAGKAATIAIAAGESEESLTASDVIDHLGAAFKWIHG
jgi:NAD(P)H-hydrate epimerase